jgi:type II secretory pathway component PulM
MKAQIIQWWVSRSQRERKLIQTLCVFLTLFIVTLTILFPMIERHREYAVILPKLLSSVDHLHKDADEALTLRQQLGAGSGTSFQSLGTALASHIEQSANESGFKGQIQSIQTLEKGQVEIVLPKVNFNRFMLWADQLKRRANIRIQVLNATSVDNAGGVQIRAVLQQLTTAY